MKGEEDEDEKLTPGRGAALRRAARRTEHASARG